LGKVVTPPVSEIRPSEAGSRRSSGRTPPSSATIRGFDDAARHPASVPPIRFERVSLTFGNIGRRSALKVLDRVNFDVDAGEFLSIIGPSGCGKSTLLSLVAGYIKPSDGRILVRGKPVLGPGSDRVMVFQSPALFPWLTTAQNIAYGLRLAANRGKARDPKATVAQLLELVGLTGFSEHYPLELSGGMRQRVEIARALAVEPDILLMDEPLGALDALTRRTMQGELIRIWQETGKTILFVTHDIEEAIVMADRVIIMSARPAFVQEEIHIDLPRPRHRVDTRVGTLSRRIAALLGVET
jgi:NitT/TauT family transport system ATP-binding protein